MYRRTVYLLRKHFFTINPPDYGYHLDTSIPNLRTTLMKRHFDANWKLSYHYFGEDLNMRRAEFLPDQYKSYQLHVRAINQETGITVYPHFELSPKEYPWSHISKENYNQPKGERMLNEILRQEQIKGDYPDSPTS